MSHSKPRMATVAVFIVSSLLLILTAANCSSERQTKPALSENATKQTQDMRQTDDSRAADNSFCYVCHMNYDGEELARIHEQVGVGCAKCHGPSFEHSSDENNITPPDIMFPKERVNLACMECHSKDNIAGQVAHQPFLSRSTTDEAYCTDCHGSKHSIAVRTVRWDKTTGKLLKPEQ